MGLTIEKNKFYTRRDGSWDYITGIDNRYKYCIKGVASTYNKKGRELEGHKSDYDLEHEGVTYKGYRVDTQLDIKTETITCKLLGKTIQCASLRGLKGLLEGFDEVIDEAERQKTVQDAFEEKAEEVSIKPVVNLIDDVSTDLVIADSSAPIAEQYTTLMSNKTTISDEILEDTLVSEIDGLAETLASAKHTIDEYKTVSQGVEPPEGFWAKQMWSKKQALNEQKIKQDDIKSQLNRMYGIAEVQYETLLATGDLLQKSRSQAELQLSHLQRMLDASNQELSQYPEKHMRPIRLIGMNSKIASAVTELKSYIMKVNGITLVAQATIEEIGMELPIMKSGLTRDTALVKLTNTIDKCQKSCRVTGNAARDIKALTSKQVGDSIVSILEEHINDDSAKRYMEVTSGDTDELSNKLIKCAGDLNQKYNDVALLANNIASNELLDNARSTVKKLSTGSKEGK